MRQMMSNRLTSSSESSIQEPSQDLQNWVPAASLEAQQGNLPHQLLEGEFKAQFADVIARDGVESFEKDLKGIMQDLSDTFTSLPKNEYGDVGHTAVRYALHRLFVARHGWYIQGIDPEGLTFNSSSPAEVLRDKLPDKVQVVIEKLLYGRGFGLYETAVLAAVLENVIHSEALSKAESVFDKLSMSTDEPQSAQAVDFAIDMYMASYVMGLDITNISIQDALDVVQKMPERYPGWTDTQVWLRSIRQNHGKSQLSFNDTVGALIDIGEKFGKYQQTECVDMKKRLMDLESQKDGCVPADHFYKSLLDAGKWEFSERPGYLRDIGALDESDPSDVKVMIPNYLTSASNCVASSSYYAVCCLNECEQILGHIESFVQGPDAEPEDLAIFVSSLASSTVSANRTLPPMLLQHLREIAKVHDGRVPLHGRLFMQWMHNAYPHECPYPHIPGTIEAHKPELWQGRGPDDSMASASEIRLFLATEHEAALNSSLKQKHAQCGKWLNSEELYVPWVRHHPSLAEVETRDAHAWAAASTIALLAAAASMIVMVLHTYRSVLLTAAKPKKLIVS